MAQQTNTQTTFFRGIYEFEDPSGCLLVAKVPTIGSVDLFQDTAVVVRPNQCALFIYKGQVADIFHPGTHSVKTENLPILTRLSNWRFGFQSPLRCELIFVSGQVFTSRRWGTPQPAMVKFSDFGIVPIRAFGNFSVCISNPPKLYTKLVGSKATFSITDIEEFIQGQIVELLPKALGKVQNLDELASAYASISQFLESELKSEMAEFGLVVQKIQVLSAVPSQEVLQAMDAKTAIKIIGSQKEYLLYKAANGLGDGNPQTGDPLQIMMGLMLGKGIAQADYHEKEKVPVAVAHGFCSECGTAFQNDANFCSKCGKKI